MNDQFDSCAMYGCDRDAETLSSHSPADALRTRLDAMGEEFWERESHTVYAWKRVTIPRERANHLAEEAVEGIEAYVSEEYGDPDDCEPLPKHQRRELVGKFRDAIQAALDSYTPWRCNRVAERSYTIAEIEAMGVKR